MKKKVSVIVKAPVLKKKEVARIDSIPVGGVKRSVKDVAKAVIVLNKSNSAKSLVKGVSISNPVSSARSLSPKSSTSDVVNKMIDVTNKKPTFLTKNKK